MKHVLMALALASTLALTGCPGEEQVTEDPPGLADTSPAPSATPSK